MVALVLFIQSRLVVSKLQPVNAKNWSPVITPPVTVNEFAIWSGQSGGIFPSAKVNADGIEVSVTELAAPVPEPPGFTNGRSMVPETGPKTVENPLSPLKVKSNIASARAGLSMVSPTTAIYLRPVFGGPGTSRRAWYRGHDCKSCGSP
jgi:hypothetical protein